MSPIVMMIFVLIAAALVFMGPDPYAEQKALEAQYGKDKLAREIGMRNDGLIEGAKPLDAEYVPPKGAKVYKLPDYMVVETKPKGSPLDILQGKVEEKEAAPAPEIPMEDWGKSEGKSKMSGGKNDSGIKYEPGLPSTFAQPGPPKPVPVEPLSGQ